MCATCAWNDSSPYFACNLLTIAIEAGFESHAAFTRAFRKRFGETPTTYRSLSKTTFQPRARMQLWHQIASGLRRHIELLSRALKIAASPVS